jgi:hypothetical protein
MGWTLLIFGGVSGSQVSAFDAQVEELHAIITNYAGLMAQTPETSGER